LDAIVGFLKPQFIRIHNDLSLKTFTPELTDMNEPGQKTKESKAV
jgi:hypothetical protein